MSRTPTISVVIPTWNRADFLAEAIASVRAQGRDDVEIIVVDDGSTDDTARVLERQGSAIRSVRQDNRGPAAARNRGIEMARGGLVAFLDSDDLWPAGSLAARLAAFDTTPATQIALGMTQLVQIDESGGGRGTAAVAPPAYVTCFGAALCRREVFGLVGVLDPALRSGEDIDWFVHCREAGVVTTLVPTVTTHLRRHSRSMTAADPFRHHGLLVAVKRSLDRRRAAGGPAIAPMRPWDAGGVSRRPARSDDEG